jgi:beta-fructofuranosidase
MPRVLRLPDHWVWDSWIADDGERYHLFFLKAPRALREPRKRHAAATVGHATSTDLANWEVHEDALGPAHASWGDLAVWTGSTVQGDDGVWRLYHAALSTIPGHGIRDQRIGLAESGDLFTWRRVADEPLVDPDPRWYRTLDEDPAASETWRDPFVFRDPGSDGWHMLITARAPGAPRFDDGVLGHARSADMRSWELQPPLTDPGAGFGQLEVPQVRVVGRQPLLVFSCHPEEQSGERRARFGHFCTWCVPGESVTGPWDIAAARPFEAEPALYAAPLVRRRDGGWAFVGFLNTEPEGRAAFELLDPIPVELRDGALVRARPA